MIRLDNLPDGIASRMLAQSGIAAIWKLHVAAAIAYRTGNLRAAHRLWSSPTLPNANG